VRVARAAGGMWRGLVRARLSAAPEGTAPAEGSFVAAPAAGGAVHVPWTILFGAHIPPGLTAVRLSANAFRPSDAAPVLLSFVAGSVAEGAVQPLSRLDLELWSPDGGRIGLLPRLRDGPPRGQS